MRAARPGYTVVEIMVATLVVLLMTVVAWGPISQMLRGQKSTDVRAARALLEAQLFEMLMRDLRSSTTAVKPGPAATSWVVTRSVLEGNALVPRDVTWTRADAFRVVRAAPGEKTVEFDFRGLLDPSMTAVEFRLEPSPDLISLAGP